MESMHADTIMPHRVPMARITAAFGYSFASLNAHRAIDQTAIMFKRIVPDPIPKL